MKRPAPRTRIIGRDSATRTMPWMVAVMAFVAALALALSLAVEAAAARFGAGLAGSVTVEVPAAETPAAGEARAAAAAAALRTVPGVLSAAVIAREATARLVEPWLGADLAGGALPLPVLIDLRVDPSQPPAPGALATALARVGPDISVDDHRLWLDRLLAWVDAVRLGALAVLACAVVGIVLTVALATRAALAIHRDVIEILHMIGAQDRYIARQFQRQALWMGLRGGLVGAVLATLLILFVGSSGSGMQPGLLPALALGAREWAAIAALPLGSAAIALLVARLVVMRALRLMM